MPRRPRIVIEGGIYHIYNRLARGADLFADPDEAERFVELLRKVKTRDGLTVFAWCVMSNHYHLAAKIGPVHLARTMGYVQFRFGQDFNRRTRSSGPRWQSRYKAKLVEDNDHLHQLVMYIHGNPVAAEVVSDPAKFLFSGHRELLGNTKVPLVDTEETLSLFGNTTRSARQHYAQAIAAGCGEKWLTELPGRLPWWKREPDKPLKTVKGSAWIDERGVSTGRNRKKLDANEFLGLACAALGVSLQRIAGPTRDRKTTRLRFLIAGLGIERWGQRQGELAAVLDRWPDVIGRWARRADEIRLEETDFEQKFERLDSQLSRQLDEPAER